MPGGGSHFLVIGGAAGHLDDLLDFEGGLNHVVRVLLLLVDWGCLSLRWGERSVYVGSSLA